ncbi:transglutaminase-like cysteine peptidase [Ancylobacter mangrovi]|uniref:Transglutaminase-like cysteine peptidase n=1 Tax=Ancylobacter mangrovi TaxID=2972472 RepID=A0A9X2PDI0_9HYPH|nr:transglutaminase-like cysteine peptidase [Ancylobacter mangrovi]MCS0495925.1 transglutaminase-like cysteine peptidase [Ancylobacter mangrovi]MCS0504658.1 transglutaminase-like cysteine peptidase [Ancylobacter mangrovi]
MKKRLERALLAAAVAVVAGTMAGSVAGSIPAEANDRLAMHANLSANMIAGDKTSTPIGYVQFCTAFPGDCGGGNHRGGKIALSEADLAQLRAVNDDINERIKPMTDMDHYGEVERWTYPEDGYGDCEDYVLLKRRTLISLGWPPETLLITVVRDHQGEGHSVLTVVTDHGDLVLDNQESAIMPWQETGYRFVKRQAQGNPDQWVSLGDVLAPLTVGRNGTH